MEGGREKEKGRESYRPLTAFFLCTQTEFCQSISQFMAFVHTSVNDMSKQYLANERRYNYTTPKSFLELVTTINNQRCHRVRYYIGICMYQEMFHGLL